MRITPTKFEGLFEIDPVIHADDRGFFLETFRSSLMIEHGLCGDYTQDNMSYSKKGVIRGLHLQLAPNEQIKLVRVVKGKVLDVTVDLRSDSQTFGKYYACWLDGHTSKMLYIPQGFAHGFATAEDTWFQYKCSGYYSKTSEAGVRYDDPDIGIDWTIDQPLVSDKDQELPSLSDFIRKYGESL